MGGTLVGLLLSGVILTLHPQGLWLAVTLMALQFTIEMLVIRNYALAVIFITAAALTIASGGHPVADVGHLLWVRGVDTVIGCFVGLGVFMLSTPRFATSRVPDEIIRTLEAIGAIVRTMAKGDVLTPMARMARRDLQHRAIALLQAYDRSAGSSPRHGDQAELMWPAVVATQRLAYRVLSTCWAIEKAGQTRAAETAQALFGATGEQALLAALADLAEAIRRDETPKPPAPLPAFVASEFQNLRDSLVFDPPSR